MQSGRIQIRKTAAKPNKFIACQIEIDDERVLEIAEYGKEKMARLHICEAGNQPPEVATLGIDPFDDC